ncbi:glycosyl hydrolase, family 25 [Lachnospiraceae bacterium KM106-2]|nr:glycosyl hydrolase, family 25 [Lachnospiraceae bacterium KM106-2]
MKFMKKHVRITAFLCALCLWVASVMQVSLDASAAAPIIQVTHPEQNTIKLSWNAVEGASGYNIYMSLASSTQMQYIASVNDTKFSFTGLKESSKYNFKIVPYTVSGVNKVEAAAENAGTITESSNKQGIDISKYQRNIDFAKLKQNTDIRFVIIRIGYTGSKTGKCTLDPYFKQNMKNAQANGFKVGVYYYSLATTQKKAQEEANFVIKNLQGYQIDYPVAMDVEDNVQKKVTKVKNSLSITTFCETVKAAGYSPMVYTGYYFMNTYLDYNAIKQYDIWLARYNSYLGYNNPVRMWQYSSKAELPGITATTVDVNYEYDKDDINGSVVYNTSKNSVSYRVASGDTLQMISDKTGMGVDQIVAQNTGITAASKLSKGKEIKLYDLTVNMTQVNNNVSTGVAQQTITVSKPTNVKAKRASASSIKVTWKKATNANQYEVYRATSKKGTYKKVKTTTATSFTNSKLTTGKTYYYKVYGVYKSGSTTKKSAASSITSAKTSLSKTTLKSAKAGKKQVKLSWSKVSSASGYRIFRATSKNGSYKKVRDVKGTSATIKGLKAKKTYYFKVKAYKNVSKKKVLSAYSNRKSTKTK